MLQHTDMLIPGGLIVAGILLVASPPTVWDSGRFVTDRNTSLRPGDMYLHHNTPWVRISVEVGVPWQQFVQALYAECAAPNVMAVRVRPKQTRGVYAETLVLAVTATVPGTLRAPWPPGFVVLRESDFELGQPDKPQPQEVVVQCELGRECMRRSQRAKATSTSSTSSSTSDVPLDSAESATPSGRYYTTACSAPSSPTD